MRSYGLSQSWRAATHGEPCRATRAGRSAGSLGVDLEPPRRDAMKTSRERAEEKRLAKLDVVRQQVERGDLVIRQVTKEERRRYPPRPVVRPQRSHR